MEHYIVVLTYSDTDFTETFILGCKHSLEEAKAVFEKERVEQKENQKRLGWEVYSDTETEFIVGDREYNLQLYIECVEE